MVAWTPQQLGLIAAARELEITTRRDDAVLPPWVPIWVVRVGTQVYVRTWYRRDTGWYGRALRSRRARIRVPGLETEVSVEDVQELDHNSSRAKGELNDEVSAAYREKYGRGGGVGGMVTPEATATTLRLVAVIRSARPARSPARRSGRAGAR